MARSVQDWSVRLSKRNSLVPWAVELTYLTAILGTVVVRSAPSCSLRLLRISDPETKDLAARLGAGQEGSAVQD